MHFIREPLTWRSWAGVASPSEIESLRS
jgi:hypothetical protein